MTREKTFPVQADTYVRQDLPTKRFSADRTLSLRNGGGNDRRAFVFFASPAPPNSYVSSATLHLFLKDGWSGAHVVTAKRITQRWVSQRLDWSPQPSITALHDASATFTAADNTAQTIDVTDMVRDVAAGSRWYGLRLEIDTSGVSNIWSQNAPNRAHRPFLVVEYSFAPDMVTGLRPDGGRLISAAIPTVAWKFVDLTDGQSQAFSQVQIDTVGDFVAPEFDSGWVANTDEQYDTNDGGYAGAGDGDPRYWRVRVKDGNGITSDWSDSAQFAYLALGTLAITFPASDGDLVDETTPPITHTLSAGTQAFSRYVVTEDGSAGILDNIDTGKTPDASSTFVVPVGVIHEVGVDYYVHAFAWDDADREVLPGAPIYSESVRRFRLQETDPDAVTDLAAADAGGHVLVTWNRAAAPDFFALRIDGRLVDGYDQIDPADVFVSGTSYALKVVDISPRVTHTIEVVAIVNDAGVLKISGSNPIISDFKWKPTGIWLLAPASDIFLQLLDTQTQSSDFIEESTLYHVINRDDPVRISAGAHGYAGSVTGTLVTSTWSSASESLAAVEAMKALPEGSDIRLIMGRRILKIGIDHLSLTGHGTVEEMYDVTVAYFQNGGYSAAGSIPVVIP